MDLVATSFGPRLGFGLRYLCDQISQDDYMESLQNFYSPLENTLMLGELQVGGLVRAVQC